MASVDATHLEPLPQRQPTGLFHLPPDIQLLIYEYALEEPNLWERRHRDGCDLCPTNDGALEHPPWVWHRPIIDANLPSNKKRDYDPSPPETIARRYTLAATWKFCSCAVRTGINLLCTNRHIFSLAAPIFWSRSKFCFFDPVELFVCITATSPGTRALIRHVSIRTIRAEAGLDPRVCIRDPTRSYQRHRFFSHLLWNGLELLPGLESLDAPIYHFHDFFNEESFGSSEDGLGELLPKIPHLTRLELSDVVFSSKTTELREDMMGDDAVTFWDALYANAIPASFASYSLQFDVGKLRDDTLPEVLIAIQLKIFHDQNDVRAWIYSVTGDNWPETSVARLAARSDGCQTVPVPARREPVGDDEGKWSGDAESRPTAIDATFYSVPPSKDARERRRRAQGKRGKHAATGQAMRQHVTEGDGARKKMIRRFTAWREAKEKDSKVHAEWEKEATSRKRQKKNRRGHNNEEDWET